MLAANWDLHLIKEKNYHCSTRDEICSLKEWKDPCWRLQKPEMNSFLLKGRTFCVAVKKKGRMLALWWFVNIPWGTEMPKEIYVWEKEAENKKIGFFFEYWECLHSSYDYRILEIMFFSLLM